jgi:RNA polymerase sigma-70 factor (ECF subfamily)
VTVPASSAAEGGVAQDPVGAQAPPGSKLREAIQCPGMSDSDSGSQDRSGDRARAEQAVRDRHDAGELDRATTLAIELYGAEVYGFLHALAREEDVAAEAFSTFTEDLWKGLGKFRWESSLRTWAYALARNALHRVRRDPARRPGRNIPLSQVGAISGMAEAIRSATSPHLRTDVKDRFAQLREELDPDDHALLILRVDRKMSWREIARAMPAEPGGEQDVEKRAATLRKRFERAKSSLRELALRNGLIQKD